jgi:DNA-binding GntR family transcriptional regulator
VGDLAYSVLRQGILSGVLQPGTHLRQDALAGSLGISRIPVRSALIQLEADGLIDFRPHRGAIVTGLTPEQVRQIYELRILLETHALRKAIASMTPERMRRLRELAARVDEQESGDDHLAGRIAFYAELYDAAGNPLLAGLVERLRADVGRFWLRKRVVGRSHEPSHARLLELVAAGDGDGAAGWLEAHLSEVAVELAALVQKQGEAPAK